jgi:hypothetical protein
MRKEGDEGLELLEIYFLRLILRYLRSFTDSVFFKSSASFERIGKTPNVAHHRLASQTDCDGT